MGLGDKVVERWHSPRTQRELTLARWGHYGAPLLVFPTAGGDAEEIERHHLLGHLAEAVDAGRVKVYSVDSTAGRALSTHEGSPEHRMWLFNQYHDAIASEVVPAIQADTGGHEIVAAGSSIGAFNALAMVCRYPQLFRAAICMSGTFHMEKFIGGFNDDLYFSSPVHFLKGMEGPQLDLLRQRFVVLASGSGRWEDTGESWAVGNVLGEKGIPEPGRRLGPGVRPRLADMVEDAPDLRGRDRRMTDDAVASAVDRLMARARDDLERLVAIPSVASEERVPVPAGREAAELVEGLYRDLGVDDIRAPRRRRRQRRRRRSDRRSGRRANGFALRALRRPAGGGRGRVVQRPVDPHRAGRPLVCARRGGLQGQPRHAPDRAAGAARRRRRLAGVPDRRVRGLGGDVDRRPGTARRHGARARSPPTSSSWRTPATSRPASRR